MKCVKCGHEMLDHSTAQTICLECPNCGWGFATTLSQPLNEDMTDYEIYLNPGNPEKCFMSCELPAGKEIALLEGACTHIQSRAGSRVFSFKGREGLANSRLSGRKFAKVYHHPGISLRNKMNFIISGKESQDLFPIIIAQC